MERMSKFIIEFAEAFSNVTRLVCKIVHTQQNIIDFIGIFMNTCRLE